MGTDLARARPGQDRVFRLHLGLDALHKVKNLHGSACWLCLSGVNKSGQGQWWAYRPTSNTKLGKLHEKATVAIGYMKVSKVIRIE